MQFMALRATACWMAFFLAEPGSSSPPASEASAKLHQLFKDEWEFNLREWPTLASSLGDKRYNARWPDVSLAATERRYDLQEKALARLNDIDLSHLTSADRLNLALFRREYETDLAGRPFRWHLLPVNHRDGIQTAHEIADSISFITVRDYEDWIERLKGIPAYVNQTTDLMREGVKARMVHPMAVMKRVPAQVQQLTNVDPTKNPFYKPFLKMHSSIDARERKRLTTLAQKAISERVAPAYQEFATYLEKAYLPACTDRVGIWQFPNGEEMYAYRARYYTTTSMTPEEIHKLGLREVERIRKEMDKVIKEVGYAGSFDSFLEHLRADPKFYYKTGSELLEAYRGLCKRVDPELVKLFRRLPRMPYGVEPIPMTIAPDTTTAYYRWPAADGSRAGTYFVNLFRPEVRPKYEMEALSLHEAVPGHHLQIAIAMEQGDLPEFRRYGGYTAFVEGWGLYAESLGSELGLYQDPYSKFGRYTYEMWRAIRLVVDTGMHRFGWTRERAIEFFLSNAAKNELDITNEVDRYISWPGQALAYKVGELKIQELKARSSKALGPKFDIRDFHDVVLSQGSLPLDLLERNVDAWIASKKSDPPKTP